MPSFTCKDLGMECSHVSSGTNNQELMRNFIAHAGSTHQIHVLPADVIYRVHKAIKK
jgi:predicted small metal-binding protein